MNSIRIRQYRDSKWIDPKEFLFRLYKKQPLLCKLATSEKELAIENQDQEIYRESREAALFCLGLQNALTKQVRFLYDEDQDRDFVIGEKTEKGIEGLLDMQLKRLPPESLNPHVDIESIIDGLKKYVDSKDLIVAIMISRNIKLDLNQIRLPDDVKLKSAFLFGAVTEDQTKWFIYGSLCDHQRAYCEYYYPTNNTEQGLVNNA